MERKSKFLVPCTTENWSSAHMKLQLHLFEVYIDEKEIGNTISLDSIKKNLKEKFIDLGDGNFMIQKTYRDVDAETFNVDMVFGESFPNLERQSSFIMLLALMEKELYDLCTNLQKKLDLNMSVDRYLSILSGKKRKKSKLNGLKEYLLKEIRLIFPENLLSLWENVATLYKIRNNIIHNFGLIENCSPKTIKFIEKNKHLSRNQISMKININNYFLKEVLTEMNRFTQLMEESIQKRLASQLN